MNRASSPRKHGRGTLHVIGGLLIASAILRMGSAGTEVIAEESMVEEAEPNPLRALPSTLNSNEIESILEAFRQREERLEARETQIANRMQAIRFAETEIAENLLALTAAEDALRATLALAEVAAEEDLARLATVYENMKPKDAAALFTEMPAEFAAGFLGLMQPEAAAAIMTELESPVAYAISVMLAGRNALVPTEER